VTNALIIDTDTLGQVVLTGPGAGGRETGFALLSDLLSIHRALA
jgi:homoserine dehydrogenase